MLLKEPWITNELLEKIRDKDCLLSRAKRTGIKDDMINARKVRNATTKLIRKARQSYIMDLIEENKNDQKKFWNEINKILPGKNKTKADITLIDQDSHIQIEHTLVSSYINNYFAGIGAKLVKKLNEPWSFDGEVCYPG